MGIVYKNMIPLVEDSSCERRCIRCKKTVEEILTDRPNLKKVFWRKGICDPCFHKLKRKCRNKEIEKDSNFGKGFRIEQVIAKVLDIRNCNIELDNYNAIFDLYDSTKYNNIQSRSAEPSIRKATWRNKEYSYDVWHIALGLSEFDTLFAVCMSKDYKNIERIYAIPIDKLPATRGLTIYKDPKIKPWYEQYRIDEKPYNDVYHSMKIGNCLVLKNE
jgi:hypothetical protein